jgi:hypothetical protein
MGRMNGILKNHVFPHEFLDIGEQTSGSPHICSVYIFLGIGNGPFIVRCGSLLFLYSIGLSGGGSKQCHRSFGTLKKKSSLV